MRLFNEIYKWYKVSERKPQDNEIVLAITFIGTHSFYQVLQYNKSGKWYGAEGETNAPDIWRILPPAPSYEEVIDGETMITEEIFGVRLKMLLQERGLSQKAFARMIDVCTASMCKWIKGSQYPHFKQLIKMADVLDISLDELCGRQSMQDWISVKDRLSEPPKE